MVPENDWRADLSPAEVLAAEQAAGRASVAKAEAEIDLEAAERAARRAPIVAKALAKLISSQPARRKRAVERALANFEVREASLKERIADGAESSSQPFRNALRTLGLDHNGDELPRRS
jgi:hypothetical protein